MIQDTYLKYTNISVILYSIILLYLYTIVIYILQMIVSGKIHNINFDILNDDYPKLYNIII